MCQCTRYNITRYDYAPVEYGYYRTARRIIREFVRVRHNRTTHVDFERDHPSHTAAPLRPPERRRRRRRTRTSARNSVSF